VLARVGVRVRVKVRVCVRVRVRVCGNSIISIKNGEDFRRERILFNNLG
jgi:hypothetical protein